MSDEVKASNFDNAVSSRTHPSPDEDSRYYSRNMPDVNLTNTSVNYPKFKLTLPKINKQKEYIL